MTSLFLIRHGRTAWNAEKRIQGDTNIPLDDVGTSQVVTLAQTLMPERFEAIYSSPLHRSLNTAGAIAYGRKLDVIQDDRLKERGYGLWTGMLESEVREQYTVTWNSDWRICGAPGGEGQGRLVIRASSFLNDILGRHTEGNIAIVSHECLLGAMLGTILKMPLEMHEALRLKNCGYARVKFISGMPRLISLQ